VLIASEFEYCTEVGIELLYVVVGGWRRGVGGWRRGWGLGG